MRSSITLPCCSCIRSLFAGPSNRLTHNRAISVAHLVYESVEDLAVRVDPFHVKRLILRLAVARDRHHVAQCDRMLAGIEIIGQSWRREKFSQPVLILTARDTVEDRISGLDTGADDYLVKPFALEELNARIRALLRRHNNQGDNEMAVGNLRLNITRRLVWLGGEALDLTPKEYALLSRLMMKAGSPVHREILYNDIYSWDNEPSTNTLEVHIHNLRDKVGKSRIRTVRGFGYMLVATEES